MTVIIAIVSTRPGQAALFVQVLLVLLAGLLNWSGAFLFARRKDKTLPMAGKLAAPRSVAIHREIDSVREIAEVEFDKRKRTDLEAAEVFGKISWKLSAISESQARNIEEWHMASGFDSSGGQRVVDGGRGVCDGE